MSTSVERYLAAAKLAGKNRDTFNTVFIGALSGSFDHSNHLTDATWDTALVQATEYVAGLGAL